MVQVPQITITLVTLAAFLYCAKCVADVVTSFTNIIIRRYATRRALRYNAMIDDLHDAVSKEVAVHFEFWWSGDPSRMARAALKTKMSVPDGMSDVLPDGMLDAFAEEFVDVAIVHFRSAARHVAIHAAMDARKNELLNALPNFYGMRDRAISNSAAHDRALDDDRKQLTEVGIDVEQLEAEFSSNR